MVITDVPFDARERAKNSRYTLIRRPNSGVPGTPTANEDEEDAEARRSKEYAAFLKWVQKCEARYCCHY